ncbi:PREDICTED: inner centromere protein A-like [Polistes canadensis]|uniref:inner centromere protein A-like n=1 Tax=Polistes canadensis TaxID=91411 RepID=UPI000718F2A5|nr:PREDICTED: inner centromere protein A-like [Polistes canadensis]XP_014612068.1 PREDICTED: inner centromere protein A-like [Polistes canadensis]
MNNYSKDRIKAMIAKDAEDLFNRCEEVKKSIRDNADEILNYLQALVAQISQSSSVPIIAKTPKLVTRKGVQRIETIPENNILDITERVLSIDKDDKPKNEINLEETIGIRKKRHASKAAADNIRKQQSMSVTQKLRRPIESFQSNNNTNKVVSENRIKRTKSSRSSDEDEDKRPSKHTKTENRKTNSNDHQKDINNEDNKMQISAEEDKSVKVNDCTYSLENRRSSGRKIARDNQKGNNNKSNEVNETPPARITDDIDEPSMYEDALPKHPPIMNSTMKVSPNLINKIMNATVVLEPLPRQLLLNETVTIKKNSVNFISNENNNKQQNIERNDNITSDNNKLNDCDSSDTKSQSKKEQKDKIQQLKEAMANKEFDELITDDESSPELKKVRGKVKHAKVNNAKKQNQMMLQSPSTSDEEVLNTPVKLIPKENATLKDIKSAYRPNALFSPYAKESVKKRVEAFEQVCMSSPKLNDVDAPTRVTRTKTRAMAAAEADKNVAQKLARKSLAKAKRISLAKQVKEEEEIKENKYNTGNKHQLLFQNEKTNSKIRQRITPLSKPKIQLPMSVNRIAQTPVNNFILPNSTKALTGSRTNILTSMDSFIPVLKTTNKRNSIDKLEEIKRKQANDENARRKREEALRLQTEEKKRKRQEKELKNRLAREAKEKQELEKRQRAEREKEEKAKLAQQLQEKQREEMEKKRLAQLQRAQEKEEKKKLEEQLRLQRLIEQEEAERLLVEQRRREQEAEKRREAEARAQQQAALDAMRLKTQMLQAQAKNKQVAANKNPGPVNYVLDSEPDDDDSDDENKPKHVIPHWAQPNVRKAQLAMQRYIPDIAIYKFFDTRKCTPDLTELFIGIDRKKLKRTSSAIWKTPPRYSMMEAE